ncbi:MAG: FKBP-type peptidyl-prolyl cis-trans isomerase [Bacteroidales bacterium]|nr:FKBP-type peptidyl-prolyl cis-trans isomerase [Bacteroidales bacterium]
MTIQDNKVVHLAYQLEVDGKIEDQASAEKPLEFIFGMGYLLPKFEENIKNLKQGDKFDFRLSAKEGYGEPNPVMIGDLPVEIFMQDGKLMEDIVFVGNIIPMMNQQGGVVPGKVLEIGEKTVKMDFNHPMAGKDLHFTGEVVLVRDATDEELTNGIHGERKSCSGGCGGCEGCGSDGDCGGNCECENK